MGRSFVVRPLEIRVNGENNFSQQWLVQHKTYQAGLGLGATDAGKQWRKMEAITFVDGLERMSASQWPPGKIGLGTH